MDPFLLLDFQINRLGYHFKNVDLLQEALTHSIQEEDEVAKFPAQNRTFQRLQVIGNAVLKFTISQYAVQTSEISANEGVLTAKKETLIQGTLQKQVGEKMFRPYATQGSDKLFIILRFQKSFKMVLNPDIPYEKFVRALLGAVYIDAGGISGDGLQTAFNLFLKLWEESLENRDVSTEKIGLSFPAPCNEIVKFWGMNGVGQNFVGAVEALIGAAVQKQHLLGEALIHQSFYETVSEFGISRGTQQHFPDYQRLEFLGDSILDLVITEVLWRQHSFRGGESTPLDHQIRNLIEAKTQKKIFEKLGLQKFVKMKAAGIPGWSKHDDIVESVIGAIYVDGGGVSVKAFILKTWSLKEITGEPDLEDLQQKLGYKFQNMQFLVRALSLPSGTSNVQSISEETTEQSKKLRDVLKYFGKSWIEFHTAEYVLRSSEKDDSLSVLVHRRNVLCSENVLQRIASYLNISSYVSLSKEEKNLGKELYMFYGDIMQSLVGAIFKDMQEAGIKMSLGKVFYRLWNPFLNRRPLENLLNIFPNPGFRSSGSLCRFEEIESNLRHGFENQYLLKQAIISGQLGSSIRYLFLGEAILDLVVSVYVTILCYMELDNTGNLPSSIDVNSLHSATLSECLDRAKNLFDIALIREYQSRLLDKIQASLSPISSGELIRRILGAIYIDMSRKSADLTFSAWKQHFMITCQFITGKPQEE